VSRRETRIYQVRPNPNFSCAHGEPDSSYTTILRTLSFENNDVRICLVNQAKIESAILVQSSNEGDSIMNVSAEELARKRISSCYTPDAFSIGGV